MIAKAWACLRKDARIDISYRLVFAFDAIDGVLMLVVYGVLAGLFGDRALDGYTPLGFLLVGVAANSALMTALICFSQVVRGVQAVGILKAVMATPTSPLVTVVLSSIYPMLRAALDLVVWMGVALLLGAPLVGLSAASVTATVLVFAGAALAMAGFGFVAAAFAVVFKRGDPIIWAFASANMLLAGVLYPTSSLPPVLERLAAWFPSTHALNGLRATMLHGAGVADVAPSLMMLGGWAVVGVPLGLWTLARALQYAREEGTLGHV